MYLYELIDNCSSGISTFKIFNKDKEFICALCPELSRKSCIFLDQDVTVDSYNVQIIGDKIFMFVYLGV